MKFEEVGKTTKQRKDIVQVNQANELKVHQEDECIKEYKCLKDLFSNVVYDDMCEFDSNDEDLLYIKTLSLMNECVARQDESESPQRVLENHGM